MFKITYDITDAHNIEYQGYFVCYTKNKHVISNMIQDKHPKICLPFVKHDVKVKKV